MNATEDNLFQEQNPSSLHPVCSANWEYHGNAGVNMWTWTAKAGYRYMVTQQGKLIQAHLTTGAAHKYTRTIGSFANVMEARQRCLEHWQNIRL